MKKSEGCFGALQCIRSAQTLIQMMIGALFDREEMEVSVSVANSHAVTKHSTENLFLALKKKE